MTAPQNPRVTQADYDLLRLLDVPATADHLLMAAHHREAAEAASKAREAALVEALSNLVEAYVCNVDTRRIAGFYTNPETEDEVLEARALLAALTKEPDA